MGRGRLNARQNKCMSMQNFLKKAGKKLVVDPDASPETDGENHATPQSSGPKSTGHAKSMGGAIHNAPAHTKKGTRKKI